MIKGTLVEINQIMYGEAKDRELYLATFEIDNFEESIVIPSKAKALAMEENLNKEFRIIIKRQVMYNIKGEPRNSIAFGIGSVINPTKPAK